VLTVEAEPAPGAVEGARMDISGENPLAGAELVQLSPAFNEESGIDPFMDGVLVSGVTRRSAAAYFGFRPGDRILSINEERIDTLIDLNRILRELEGEKTWPIEIERQGERFSRTLSL
jgi:S1-C subfamily serine protease